LLDNRDWEMPTEQNVDVFVNRPATCGRPSASGARSADSTYPAVPVPPVRDGAAGQLGEVLVVPSMNYNPAL